MRLLLKIIFVVAITSISSYAKESKNDSINLLIEKLNTKEYSDIIQSKQLLEASDSEVFQKELRTNYNLQLHYYRACAVKMKQDLKKKKISNKMKEQKKQELQNKILDLIERIQTKHTLYARSMRLYEIELQLSDKLRDNIDILKAEKQRLDREILELEAKLKRKELENLPKLNQQVL